MTFIINSSYAVLSGLIIYICVNSYSAKMGKHFALFDNLFIVTANYICYYKCYF